MDDYAGLLDMLDLHGGGWHVVGRVELSTPDEMCELAANAIRSLLAELAAARDAAFTEGVARGRAEADRDNAVRAQASLRLEINSMRSSDWYKDAERYRWLRNSSPPHLCVRRWQRITPHGVPQPESSVRGSELDSVIDAARTA